ncbi:CLUMA_CG000014, isoform A [Clunio marinus]|uniref:CLUMA_CG000014, isoform A n=1 Tax=Clunio marinus TaxID=568069 RepID=A0A1J1HIM9_9DIPT|nr:CLUMA_CG000014, isoform A [Clunio marinus]
MESTGSPFPRWQLAILLGTPLAIGLGYFYWRKQQTAIEESVDDVDEKADKKLKKGVKSISIDGDTTLSAANGVKKSAALKDEPAKKKDLSPFEQAVKHKESGNECFKNGKYDEAIKFYNQAIDVCPKDKDIDLSQFYQNRAAAYEQLKKWTSVEQDCTKALELNPRYIKALHRRCRAYENLKQLELCLEDVTAVAILEGFQNNNSLIFADRILKDLGMKHAKEAMLTKEPVEPSKHFVVNYFKSFSQDPVHKVVVTSSEPKGFVRAIKAFKDANYNEVINACTEEIETCEDDSEYKLEAILLRGTFYLLSGQYELSLKDLNTIIKNKEADAKLRSNALTKRASLHMQTDEKNLSFEDFEKAIEIDPENPDIYHHRGQVYLLVEELQNAVADFSKATKLAPKNPLTYVHKLYSEYRQAVNDQDNTKLFAKVEEFSEAIKQFPSCIEVYSLFAQILSDQQQFELSDDYFEKAMKIEPGNAGLYVHRGLLNLQWKGNMNEALKMLEKAIEVDDKCEFAYETLGTVEVQRGNLERAISLFEKAMKLAKSEMELIHIFSLKDAAQAQLNVTKKMGLSLASLMSSMPQ